MRFAKLTGLLAIVLIAFQVHAADMVTSKSGLKYVDTVAGSGAEAKAGKKVTIVYTGWLDRNGRKGLKVESSKDKGKPVELELGKGTAIKGLEEGIPGMKTGGRRVLLIPAKLAYGEKGQGKTIPPNANLMYEIELVSVK